MSEITSNAELEIGKYYHCFFKDSGSHSIQKCEQDAGTQKYLGVNRIWAADDNNQALSRWRIFEVDIPKIDTIYMCEKHHGYVFSSDCTVCKSEAI